MLFSLLLSIKKPNLLQLKAREGNFNFISTAFISQQQIPIRVDTYIYKDQVYDSTLSLSLTGALVRIESCIFQKCRQNISSESPIHDISHYKGTAIHISGPSVSIQKTDFLSNENIVLLITKSPQIEIDSCKFLTSSSATTSSLVFRHISYFKQTESNFSHSIGGQLHFHDCFKAKMGRIQFSSNDVKTYGSIFLDNTSFVQTLSLYTNNTGDIATVLVAKQNVDASFDSTSFLDRSIPCFYTTTPCLIIISNCKFTGTEKEVVHPKAQHVTFQNTIFSYIKSNPTTNIRNHNNNHNNNNSNRKPDQTTLRFVGGIVLIIVMGFVITLSFKLLFCTSNKKKVHIYDATRPIFLNNGFKTVEEEDFE